MTKIIKDLSFEYKNEEVPNRLWHKIQGTIQNQENTVSFFSFQKIIAVAAVMICVIGINIYQKQVSYQLVNTYLYDEFIAMDFSDDFSTEEPDWDVDDILGTL